MPRKNVASVSTRMFKKRVPKVSKNVKRYVKKAIHVDKEKKCALDAGKLATQSMTTTGALYELLDFIGQGDTDSTREGNDIRVSHVQTLIQAFNTTSGTGFGRIIMAWSPTPLAYTDFPTSPIMPVNTTVLQHVQILYDKHFFLQVTAAGSVYPFERFISINKKLLGRKVTYDNGANTIDKGHLYLYTISDSSVIQFNGVTRVRFTE